MFRHFILDFECNEIIGTLYGSDDNFASHFQKVLIFKELVFLESYNYLMQRYKNQDKFGVYYY